MFSLMNFSMSGNGKEFFNLVLDLDAGPESF